MTWLAINLYVKVSEWGWFIYIRKMFIKGQKIVVTHGSDIIFVGLMIIKVIELKLEPGSWCCSYCHLPSLVLRGSIICPVLRYKQCHLHNQWCSFLRHIRSLTSYFRRHFEPIRGQIWLQLTNHKPCGVWGMLMFVSSQPIHHCVPCVRCVSPILLMTWPTLGAQFMTQAATVTRRTWCPHVPETPGEHDTAARKCSWSNFPDVPPPGVSCASVSHPSVTVTPWPRTQTPSAPGAMCARWGWWHLIMVVTISVQDCVCQPRFPPGCSCDPFSADPDSSCPRGQSCRQCKCLGKQWHLELTSADIIWLLFRGGVWLWRKLA